MPFLDFTMIQCTIAHAFLDCYMEADDSIPQILKERAAVRLFAQLLKHRRIWGTTGLGFGI